MKRTSENKSLILLGGGGHCKSVIDALLGVKKETYDDIWILDPSLSPNEIIEGICVAGDDSKLPEFYTQGCRDAFITAGSIADTRLRHQLKQKAEEAGMRLINVFDHSAIVAGSANVGNGVFIGKRAIVNAGCDIADMAIINTAAILEHDCRIGAYTHVSVGAILCGNVTIGNDSLVGAGATVIQGISIGSHVVVGAGATVLRDLQDGEKVTGIVK